MRILLACDDGHIILYLFIEVNPMIQSVFEGAETRALVPTVSCVTVYDANKYPIRRTDDYGTSVSRQIPRRGSILIHTKTMH